MSNVWYCLPSARPSDEAQSCIDKWSAKGYKIAVFREYERGDLAADIRVNTLPYQGYAVTANLLLKMVFDEDSACDWAVMGADDIHPDARCPHCIARECLNEFGSRRLDIFGSSFGVMQPTGHRWGDRQGPYIDRVAGSPWIGREFARRAYGGRGPYWPEYFHMGCDEEVMFVAEKLGVYWRRPDLTHFHQHWGLPKPGERIGQRSRMPAFLERANSPEEWARYKALFNARKEAGFAGHEPL